VSYDSPPNAKTQRGEILALLIKAHGEWVPLPEIMACAAQYNARVFELRRLGFNVENRTETDSDTGQRHSWFRLVSTVTKSTTETRSRTSGDWFDGPRPKADAPPSGDVLPLFAEGRP